MNSPAKKLATYEDLYSVPENMVGEIIAGQLHTSPRPSPRHSRSCSELGGELTGPFSRGRGGPGGWLILVESELHLEGHVLVPDLAGWRKERIPGLPEGNGFTIVPDWVCEVISPGSVRLDRVIKTPLYAQLGVQYLWLIDPIAKTLEAYHSVKGQWQLIGAHAESDKVRVAPFDAIELDLSVLWWE